MLAAWIAGTRVAPPEARTFTLTLASPEESVPERPESPPLEPARTVLDETPAEPRLVEQVVESEPMLDAPPDDASAAGAREPGEIAAQFHGGDPWPRFGRVLASARARPGAASVPTGVPTSSRPALAAVPAAPDVCVAARPDPARAPSPVYPRLARLRGWQGTVLLEVSLDAEGRPLEVAVSESSGHRVLDEAARAAVLGWRFQPATRNGLAEASRVLVPIVWRLVTPSVDAGPGGAAAPGA